MRKILRTFFTYLAVLGFVLGGQANATTIGQSESYSFGLLETTKAVSVNEINGTFFNHFEFVQAGYSGVRLFLSGLFFGDDLSASVRTWSSDEKSAVEIISLSDLQGDGFIDFDILRDLDGLITGRTYYLDISGYADDGAYSLTVSPVPEPGTLAVVLWGLGLLGLFSRVRRQKVVD